MVWLFTGDFFSSSLPVFVRCCKCSEPISISLLVLVSPAPPHPMLSLRLCFVFCLSCTPLLCLGSHPPRENWLPLSLQDSTSGPHNPFWGHPVTLWELEKWPLWKCLVYLKNYPGIIFCAGMETGPMCSWKPHTLPSSDPILRRWGPLFVGPG